MDLDNSNNNNTSSTKRKCPFKNEGEAPKLITVEKYAGNLSAKDAKLLVNVLEGKEEESFPEDTAEGGLEEFRKALLQIVANNLPREAITPGIIVHLGYNIDLLFDQVENDKTFILLALTTGINCDFFCREQEVEIATSVVASEEALIKDFLKIKSRWAILDNITEMLFDQSAGTDASINRLINAKAYSIKKRFFDRLLNSVSRYSEATGMMEPLDVSFSVSMIRRSNFEKVTNLVEKNLIIFFRSSPHSSLDNLVLEDKNNFDSPNVKHKRRRIVLRNFTLENVLMKILEMFTLLKDDVEDDERRQDFHEMARMFEKLVFRLNSSQSFNLIKYWEVPLPVLLRVFNNAVTGMKRSWMLSSLDWPRFGKWVIFGPRWCNECFGWLVETIIEKRGLDSISKNGLDYIIDITINLDTYDPFRTIFEKYKDKLSVKRIKDMALFIVTTNTKSCSSKLEILLNNFPWLLNTWFDYEGNTLLCLCVRFGYKYLDNLLALDMVKKHINVESMDGRNPLFMAADHPNKNIEFHRLWKRGGADLTHVNCHHESVFHRLAASNNSKCLQQLKNDSLFVKEEAKSILELRRNRDAATALMVALARENVGVATILINLGASVTTKFLCSKTLRTAEVLFLQKKKLSVALLAEAGVEPMSSIIVESFKEKTLFEEECFVSMTEIENNDNMDNAHTSWFANRRDNISLSSSTWCLFNEKGELEEWLTPLLNNKVKELQNIITKNVKNTLNEKCDKCCVNFEDQSSSSNSSSSNNIDDDDNKRILRKRRKGFTDCGHSFHDACWKELGCSLDEICPVCCQSTSIYFIDSFVLTSSEPNENVVIIPKPTTTVRRFRRKKTTSTGDEEKQPPNVVGYEFLIDGKWIDESSPLNELLA